jgi:hypothetical protein
MRGVASVLAVTLLLLTNATAAIASNLSTKAAQMTPGTFVELTSMTGWDNGGILNPPGCSGGDVITQYANKAVWNPITRRFQFSGSPHMPCSGTNERAVYYDDATNTWGTLPTPPGSKNDPRHSYDHNTINPATGELYYTYYNANNLVRLSTDGGSWATLASRPGNSQCCRAQAWFPDMSGGRLIHYDGDWGIRAYNPATNSWTQLSRGNGSDGTSLPQLPAEPYQVFAHYSPLCQCVVFGGGVGFYKLNSNGTFTTLSKSGAPSGGQFRVGPGGTSIVTEPVTGVLLFVNGSTMAEFNPSGTGSWRTLSVSVPAFFREGDSTSESLISAPISTYGVVMYVKHDDAGTGHVYLYKHAPSSPQTTPGVPVNVIAQ